MRSLKILSLLFLAIVPGVSGQGRFGMTLLKEMNDATTMIISPDGTYFLSRERNACRVWNRTATGYIKGQGLVASNSEDDWLDIYAITNDGNLIAAASTDDRIYVFRRIAPGKFKKITTITDFEDYPDKLSFSADGRYLAASNGDVDDKSTWIIYRIDGDVFTRAGEQKSSDDLQFDPTHPNLIWAGDKLYEFNDGKLTYPTTLPDHKGNMFDEDRCISPDGNLCAGWDSYDRDQEKILVWKRSDRTDFRLLATIDMTKRTKITWMGITPDNRYIVAYDDYPDDGKKRLMVFKIEDDSLVYDSDVPLFKSKFNELHFSNDGAYALTEGWDELLYKLNGVKGNSFYKTKPVITATSQVKTSPIKPDTIIKTIPPPQVNITNVVWITPNPDVMNDKPVISEKDMIEIQVKVISNKVITKDDIKVIINGKEMPKNKFNEVSLKEGPKSELNEFTYINSVPLEETPDNINTIEVYANGKNTKTLKVLYSPAKPNLHILSIGASTDRQFSQKDAQDFAYQFVSQGTGKTALYSNVSIKMLIGKEATATAIKESIEKFRYDFKTGGIGPKDVVLIFISAQAFMMDGQLRLQGYDYKDMYKETYSLAYMEILNRLKEVNCKKLIFLDAAYQGGAKSGIADINTAVADLNRQPAGVITFGSTSGEEFSYEDKKWQNSAFLYCLKEALGGKADKDANKIITLDELYDYVSMQLPALVKEEKNRPQHPSLPVNELLKNMPLFIIN